MENLIPVISKLQDVFQTAGERETFKLPQIVVVGSQSCGKSSVLENIVGRDFLPRGTGIVTRVPLMINLKCVSKGEANTKIKAEEWATFRHQPTKVYESFEDVKREIVRRTEEITGVNKGISDEEIVLSIYSPYVVNLTMVDLPGMTKVPVGDQPKDIEQQLRQLVMSYITNPNSVILAVSAATNDIANSESLKIAKEVDPHGERTLAVLTKLDLMDKGTSALDLLSGTGAINVKLGIVGVVNRGQQDIINNVPIREALQHEKNFFKVHYPSVCHHCGTAYLSRILNVILLDRIRDSLPSLRKRIKKKQVETAENLDRLGEPLGDSSEKGLRILNSLTSFAESFSFSISGGATYGVQNLPQGLPLDAGAQLFKIFSHDFGRFLKSMDALSGLTRDSIVREIRNTVGPRPVLFVPDRAFESLVKKQIQRLESPSVDCVNKVYEKLKRILRQCLNAQDVDRFPTLKEHMLKVASKYVDNCVPEAVSMVKNLIAIELAYINTDHPRFEGLSSLQEAATSTQASQETLNDLLDTIDDEEVNQFEVVDEKPMGAKDQKSPFSFLFSKNTETMTAPSSQKDKPTQKPSKRPQSSESSYSPEGKEMQISIVEKLITSYFGIVRQTIQDAIPKTITHFLVNKLQKELSKHLVGTLYKPELFDSLLSEDPEIDRQRVESRQLLESMDKAVAIISEIDETADF